MNGYDIHENYGNDENEATFDLSYMPENWMGLESKDIARDIRDEYIVKNYRALKLQELVKERINADTSDPVIKAAQTWLQSLVKESEK